MQPNHPNATVKTGTQAAEVAAKNDTGEDAENPCVETGHPSGQGKDDGDADYSKRLSKVRDEINEMEGLRKKDENNGTER